jgi:rare lipoprotein A (peptidoglycan hydrolase)
VLADQPAVPEGYFVGTATWYDAARGSHSSWYTRAGITLYGAIGADVRAYKQHRWRTSWDVKITSLRTGKSVIVQVVDICTCYGIRSDPHDQRLIDLSPQTWAALGVPLWRGVTPITLEVLP